MPIFVSVAAARNVTKMFMGKMQKHGWSYNKFETWARKSKAIPTWRRQDMQADWRRIGGIAKYQKQLESLPRDNLIPKGYSVPSQWKRKRTFTYVTKRDEFDPMTGKMGEKFTSVISNNQLIKDQVLTEAEKNLEDDPKKYGTEWENLNLYQVELKE